jgi:hypothetical protein
MVYTSGLAVYAHAVTLRMYVPPGCVRRIYTTLYIVLIFELWVLCALAPCLAVI